MSNESFPFKIGKLECMAVSDGTYIYTPPTFPPPATFLFANAPRERLEQALREHNLQPEQWVEWVSPYICVVINTGEHWVLVDTGAGGLDPNTGKLLQNLKAEGVAPEDIDTVILTHATLCGKTSGIFGPQNRRNWNLINTSEKSSWNSRTRTSHRFKANST